MVLLQTLRERFAKLHASGPLQSNLTLFLKTFAQQIERDSQLLKEYAAADGSATSLPTCQVIVGAFESKKSYILSNQHEKIDYIFVQIPGKPGFLLERAETDEALVLHRANRVNPRVTDQFGQHELQTVFVVLRSNVTTFQVLEPELVRSSNGQTLSVEQMADLILSLACEAFNR